MLLHFQVRLVALFSCRLAERALRLPGLAGVVDINAMQAAACGGNGSVAAQRVRNCNGFHANVRVIPCFLRAVGYVQNAIEST
jgi:hypothetical protein